MTASTQFASSGVRVDSESLRSSIMSKRALWPFSMAKILVPSEVLLNPLNPMMFGCFSFLRISASLSILFVIMSVPPAPPPPAVSLPELLLDGPNQNIVSLGFTRRNWWFRLFLVTLHRVYLLFLSGRVFKPKTFIHLNRKLFRFEVQYPWQFWPPYWPFWWPKARGSGHVVEIAHIGIHSHLKGSDVGMKEINTHNG